MFSCKSISEETSFDVREVRLLSIIPIEGKDVFYFYIHSLFLVNDFQFTSVVLDSKGSLSLDLSVVSTSSCQIHLSVYSFPLSL